MIQVKISKQAHQKLDALTASESGKYPRLVFKGIG